MKNYVLFLFITFVVLSSCSMRKDDISTSISEKESLLTKHQWKGMDMSQYLNGNPTGKITINNLGYNFKNNNQFVLKDNGQIIITGSWQLLNISDQPVLKLNYINIDQDQVEDDYEISILTEKYLQLGDYSYDQDNNRIQKDYLFGK